MDINKIGFIITRHVSQKIHDTYWKKCYNHIRHFYNDNIIIIIDDNSNYELIDIEFQNKLNNTIIIQSEYIGRGELLFYYYYLKYPLFNTAVCIHDSVFINKYIDFDTNSCSFIWHFDTHEWDNTIDEQNIIKQLKNSQKLLDFYNNKNLWKGCFGVMSVISYEFLKKIDDLYDFERLLNIIKNKHERCCFERIFACMIHYNTNFTSLYGDINEYCQFGIQFQYINNLLHLPIIKVWSGR
jgi:hypothetical protein